MWMWQPHRLSHRPLLRPRIKPQNKGWLIALSLLHTAACGAAARTGLAPWLEYIQRDPFQLPELALGFRGINSKVDKQWGQERTSQL